MPTHSNDVVDGETAFISARFLFFILTIYNFFIEEKTTTKLLQLYVCTSALHCNHREQKIDTNRKMLKEIENSLEGLLQMMPHSIDILLVSRNNRQSFLKLTQFFNCTVLCA